MITGWTSHTKQNSWTLITLLTLVATNQSLWKWCLQRQKGKGGDSNQKVYFRAFQTKQSREANYAPPPPSKKRNIPRNWECVWDFYHCKAQLRWACPEYLTSNWVQSGDRPERESKGKQIRHRKERERETDRTQLRTSPQIHVACLFFPPQCLRVCVWM